MRLTRPIPWPVFLASIGSGLFSCAPPGANSSDRAALARAIAADFPEMGRASAYPPNASRPGTDTPDAFTLLLERLWPLADIQAFCVPQRRAHPLFQWLVPYSPEVWKGRLHADRSTGFDRIAWYATVEDGRMRQFNLTAHRGEDAWLVELGSLHGLDHPPDRLPDPSRRIFVGDREPADILDRGFD